jgi:hypothetical protein
MNVMSSPGLSGGGAITTARYVGDWYGATSGYIRQGTLFKGSSASFALK